ncbi:uncharacterized protein A4U43_C01F28830 [Asparagus officinalis]|uniref:Uncharacterized protein n=1 Tax=Asparagus officinalis TaxID=4686 RepID=A0A5P1FUS1_ASPOF|nr:uncharacterized protein A4U43_C01F28830 [Asparagus officinalis]
MVIMCTCYGQKLENISSDSVIGVHAVQDGNHEIQPLSSNDHHSESGDDSISDEENAVLSKLSANYGAAAVQTNRRPNLTSPKQPDACTWSAIIEEAHELATVSKKTEYCPITSEMSEVRGIHTGDKGSSRPKFSFRSLPQRGNSSGHTALKDRNENPVKYATEGPTLFNKCEHGTVGDLVAEMFENLHEESDKLPMKVAPYDQRSEVPSVAELLENLQQKDEPSTGPPNLLPQNIKAKERKMQYDRKRILPHLGGRILDSEDSPEFSGDESSDDEHDNDHRHLYVATQNVKGHTMADLFQEAFSKSEIEASPYPTAKQTGIGYLGRLQQVLQIEKDRHLQFLKHSQTVRSPNDSECLDVQILTRFLEAKLTVCQCLLEFPV